MASYDQVSRSETVPVAGSPFETLPFAVRMIALGERSLRVVVEGELDLSTSGELSAELDRHLDDGYAVLLDLSQVRFIDSTGLHAILDAVVRCRSDGNRLTVFSTLQPQVRRLLELVGVFDRLPLADD